MRCNAREFFVNSILTGILLSCSGGVVGRDRLRVWHRRKAGMVRGD